MFENGLVVISTAGRDKDRLLTVVKTDSSYVWVCDGKERPLNNPKRKNFKHVVPTAVRLSDSQTRSDCALRKALAIISADIEKRR